VEIKSAVPRCDLSPPEISRAGDFSLGDHSRFPVNTTIEVTKREFFKLSPESSFPSASNTPQVHSWQKLGESQHIQTNENTACTSRLSPVKELPDSYLSPVMRGSSRSIQASNPSWLTKFLQWLPVFLTGVSMRLKEGDWYPLSSLKGDFRATCGLELDHLGLGYEKLSDFIRCLPDLCRMKIVPVGRGPATHMVLLPGLPQFAPTATLHGQGRPHSPFSTIRSSTDGIRTYADVAACQSASLSGKAYPVPAPPGFIPPVVASGAVSYPVPAAQGFIPPLVPSGAGPTNFTAPLQAGQPVDLTTSILQFETMSFAPPTAPSLVDVPFPLPNLAYRGGSSTTGLPFISTGPVGNIVTGDAAVLHGHNLEITNLPTRCPELSSSSDEQMNLVTSLQSSDQIGSILSRALQASGNCSANFSSEEWAILTGLLSSHKTGGETNFPQDRIEAIQEQDRASTWLPSTEIETANSQIDPKPFTVFNHPFTGFMGGMWGEKVQDTQDMEGCSYQVTYFLAACN
jgi:hypothetical protein